MSSPDNTVYAVVKQDDNEMHFLPECVYASEADAQERERLCNGHSMTGTTLKNGKPYIYRYVVVKVKMK